MNTLRLAAVATIALIGAGAWAQELTPEQAQVLAQATGPATSQDVGGVAPSAGAGAPQGATRQQVYVDLVCSEKPGQMQIIQNSTYHGQ
ncbi:MULTISPECIES: hypothetical protein [Paraburkholderia]|uniref:DUF4148 domain-containing protein n=1 Tax=Paraburkholderia podalyriae TaxID=1938811 RepID=A0ABR7Q1L8_9BURK|nr:hypothetical protein [Paraburkholderia podalyriae]MBC8752450.1 hypothetical protein [Paraburkholderia podalyriae]